MSANRKVKAQSSQVSSSLTTSVGSMRQAGPQKALLRGLPSSLMEDRMMTKLLARMMEGIDRLPPKLRGTSLFRNCSYKCIQQYSNVFVT